MKSKVPLRHTPICEVCRKETKELMMDQQQKWCCDTCYKGPKPKGGRILKDKREKVVRRGRML